MNFTQPASHTAVMDERMRLHNDVPWRDGRLGLYVHFGGEDVLAVAKDAYVAFSENARVPTAFPAWRS